MKYSWSLTSVIVFWPDPPRGGSRAGQKYVTGGTLLQETSSDRKATATNQMHSNDQQSWGKKCCYFWFHSEVKFLTHFDLFLDLVILPYFKAISIGIFESPKCDVNPQPNTRGIGPLVGRTSRYRRSVMHVLAVILSITCHFFFICQNIFIRVIWSGRKICPLLMDPKILLVF